jgi:hypothetical protein
MRSADKASVLGGSITAIGAALVGVCGPLCCAGPVVFAVLGVGGAVAACGPGLKS